MFYRCRNWGRVARHLSCGHVASMWFKYQLWPKSSGSYFLFLCYKPHLQRTSLMALILTCKTLHILSTCPNSFHKLLPHWERDPAALGNSILFFKNSTLSCLWAFIRVPFAWTTVLELFPWLAPSHLRVDLSDHPIYRDRFYQSLIIIFLFFRAFIIVYNDFVFPPLLFPCLTRI